MGELEALRAELAALREECDMLRSELEDGMGRTWREDRDKARALLARAVDLCDCLETEDHHWRDACLEARAFLDQRRDGGGR